MKKILTFVLRLVLVFPLTSATNVIKKSDIIQMEKDLKKLKSTNGKWIYSNQGKPVFKAKMGKNINISYRYHSSDGFPTIQINFPNGYIIKMRYIIK